MLLSDMESLASTQSLDQFPAGCALDAIAADKVARCASELCGHSLGRQDDWHCHAGASIRIRRVARLSFWNFENLLHCNFRRRPLPSGPVAGRSCVSLLAGLKSSSNALSWSFAARREIIYSMANKRSDSPGMPTIEIQYTGLHDLARRRASVPSSSREAADECAGEVVTKHLRRLLFEEWSPNPDTRRSDHAGPNARSFAAGRWGTAIRGVATQLLRMRHAVFAALAAVPVAGPGLLWDAASAQAIGESWRGLTVSQESRCTPYARRDYPYSGSVEAAVIASMDGRVYGPYTGRYFASGRQTDVEHIVAVSEAHDSGLCAAEPATRRRFSGDLLNLTLAAPKVNRCGHGGKCGYDAGEWLPPRNVCWFAGRVVAVKLKYDLTVDMREAAALEQVLSGCLSTELVFVYGEVVPAEKKTAAQKPGSSGGTVDALGLYDDNGNGHITCAEARRHGIAPVPRGHPAYRFMTDGDGDGVVCE